MNVSPFLEGKGPSPSENVSNIKPPESLISVESPNMIQDTGTYGRVKVCKFELRRTGKKDTFGAKQ